MVDNKNTLLKKLKDIGFDDKVALVYVSIVELGQTTASRVARHARLKRTTVYNVLPSLIEQGLIEKNIIRNVSTFTVSNVSMLSRQVEERVSLAKEIESELTKIKTVYPTKSQITVHEGVEGLKKIYNDIIDETPKDTVLYAYYHVSNSFKQPPEDILAAETKARVKKGIHLKLISDNRTIIQDDYKTNTVHHREVKFITPQGSQGNGETILTEDKIIHISYSDNYLCTVIQNKDIVAMQRMAFEQLWERL